MTEKKVPKLEKRIILTAFILSSIHLGLIGFAVWKLGIVVPDCVTNVKPFTEGKLIQQGPKRIEVHVVARMWSFEPNVIRIPAGSTVDFYLISRDITHGFYIDNTNVNLMAVPNVVNYSQARFRKPGRHNIMCHEYCGTAHHQMHGVIEVVEGLTQATIEGIPSKDAALLNAGANHPGLKLLDEKGCLKCHSLDGSKGLAPTFKGIWGRSENFTDGSSIASIDEAYIRESIKEPNKRIVAGFDPLMPVPVATNEDIEKIVDYLKTAK